MNQRLVWNFEFSPLTTAIKFNKATKIDALKWESRYFWSADEIVVINPVDELMLELVNYKRKLHQDCYYLLAGADANLKKRNEKIIFKPLEEYSSRVRGFGDKILVDSLEETNPLFATFKTIISKGREIQVIKQAFTFKFATFPTTRLELSRLEVMNQTYHSICIEGRSQKNVEKISKLLLPHSISCDYVSFLQTLFNP